MRRAACCYYWLLLRTCGVLHADLQGEWVRNMREGTGVEVLVTGERYEGQWSANQRHGRGTIRFSSGMLRKGIWRHGEVGLWESEEYLPPSELLGDL